MTVNKKRGCGLGCLAVAMLGMLLLFVVAGGVFFVVAARQSGGGHGFLNRGGATMGEDELPRLREVWSSGDGAIKVARIPLNGAIMLSDNGWLPGENGSAAAALRAIRCATVDSEVQALLLEIDSPGGGITASDVLYREVCNFKEAQEGRIVVALLGDIAASGGYYVALAADRIVAHPTTITGSIGVLMQSFNLSELTDKLGIKDVTIKSGANKDMLNPLREVSPAQLAMLQEVVDAMHTRFVRLVADHRELSEAQVRALADGRIFLADQAKESGLIDGIGYAADAEDQVAELLKDDDLRFIRYVEQPSLFDLFRAPSLLGAADVKRLLSRTETRLLYQMPF